MLPKSIKPRKGVVVDSTGGNIGHMLAGADARSVG